MTLSKGTFVVLILLVGLLFLVANSNQSSCGGLPTCANPRQGHKPSVNGCGPRHSKILNLLGNFLFKAFEGCCNNHDICYETCGVVRDNCDNQLYNCMKQVCKKQSRLKRAWCELKAKGIHMGLKPNLDVNCKAFAGGQTKACDCSSPEEDNTANDDDQQE